jgi:DnaJ family protein C protein 8
VGTNYLVLEGAYRSLMDVEKRNIYTSVMKEAKERVIADREKVNKKRKLQGLPQLPEDALPQQILETGKQLLVEIEEKKKHLQRLEESTKIRQREREEERIKEEISKREKEKEWEHSRDKRVKSWHKFLQSHKKVKIPQGGDPIKLN